MYENKELMIEATTLSKAEAALNSVEQIDKRIKKYQNTIEGKASGLKRKDGQLLTQKYCREKINLLKKLKEQIKTGGAAKEAEQKKEDGGAQKIMQTLLNSGEWEKSKQNPGVLKNTTGNEKFDFQLKITEVAAESVFEANVAKLIFEETNTVNANAIITLKQHEGMDKEDWAKKVEVKLTDDMSNADIIGLFKDKAVEVFKQEETDNQQKKEQSLSNAEILSKISAAYDKLTEDEQAAFDYFYGAKLEKLLSKAEANLENKQK